MQSDTPPAPGHSYEPGAPAAGGTVPLCVPQLAGNEGRYLQECLDSTFVSSVGPFVTQFEATVAAVAGAGHGVATSSGTAALHVALLLAGVERDDEVLVSTLSFIAPANAVRYVGAWPVFVDAEPEYWQMDARKLEQFLDAQCTRDGAELRNTATGRRVRAIIPVHILGHPCDMNPILAVAARHGLPVIEDATESLGARYRGRPVGSLGALGCFSFNGNKLITTGGGGMLVTNEAVLASRGRYLTTQAKDDPIEYVHHTVGFNYRLTNLQAAFGCAQLEQLPAFIERKREIARIYDEELRRVPGITVMPRAPWAESVSWLYTVLVQEAAFGMGSRGLLRALGESGIQARPLWQPLHRSPAHAGAGATDCAIADRLHRDALSLPSSVGLQPSDQKRVVQSIWQLAARGG